MTDRNSDTLIQRPSFTLTPEQRIAWLRLIRSDNVGPATFRDLINHCGSAQNALQMLPEIATRGGKKRHPKIPTVEEAEKELEATERFGAHIVGIGEANYPEFLRQAPNPPPLITIKGNSQALTQRSISIVGSRNASLSGIRMAQNLAKDLGDMGFIVVSGLARGIDKAAHEAALGTGTVAVLAGGINLPFPPENIELLSQIEESGVGACITEMPFDWQPRSRDFPRRNRLIAGLSLGLIVVEAAKRSGSLITARIAAESGRLVFAVPGSPLDPRAYGTNGLIKDGAQIVTDAQDVVQALEPLDPRNLPALRQETLFDPGEIMELPPDDDARGKVVSLLGTTPVETDDIIAYSGLTPGAVALIILELDLAGRIERHSGGLVSLIDFDP